MGNTLAFELSSLGAINYDQQDVNGLSSVIISIKSSLETQLENSLQKSSKLSLKSSKTRSLIKLVHKNFDNYHKMTSSNKLGSSLKAGYDQKVFKALMAVEKLVEKDNKKIKDLLKKLENDYKDVKNDKEKPRILQTKSGAGKSNKEFLEEFLDKFLEFSKKCVNVQRKKLMENEAEKEKKKIEKAEEKGKILPAYKSAGVHDLTAIFKKFSEKPIDFINTFPDKDIVKTYIKKSVSKTGRILKKISELAANCRKVYNGLDQSIKEVIDFNGGQQDAEIDSSADVKKLHLFINSLDKLIDIFKLVIANSRKSAKLASLYDPDVMEHVGKLHDTLIEWRKKCKIADDSISVQSLFNFSSLEEFIGKFPAKKAQLLAAHKLDSTTVKWLKVIDSDVNNYNKNKTKENLKRLSDTLNAILLRKGQSKKVLIYDNGLFDSINELKKKVQEKL